MGVQMNAKPRLVAITIFALTLSAIGVENAVAYNAAVVEYNPTIRASVDETYARNIEYYEQYISEAGAKGVDIIVFPEYGLTGAVAEAHAVRNYALPVPDPIADRPLCKYRESVSDRLVRIACAATNAKTYVVVNVLERANRTSGENTISEIFYNTNVVFDRAGSLVAKYRKINLFDENALTPGINVTTFTTDFGVTFGMFVCFDVLFKNPALDVFVANPQVTDIIYSSYWFSQAPFLTGLSVHSGYARANGVNMLSSAISNASSGSSGSGIYGHDGIILTHALNYASTSQLLSATVEKIDRRTPPNRDPQMQPRVRFGGHRPNSDGLKVLAEDLTGYAMSDLPTDRKFQRSVCHQGHCCNFDIEQADATESAKYKLVAYYGYRNYGHQTKGRFRVCGLVTCANGNDPKTCGKQSAATVTNEFKLVSINGTFDYRDLTFDFPTTLTTSLDVLDARDYAFYKKNASDGKVDVFMRTTGTQTNLTTFAIYGRVFHDYEPTSAGRSITVTWILLSVSLIGLVHYYFV